MGAHHTKGDIKLMSAVLDGAVFPGIQEVR